MENEAQKTPPINVRGTRVALGPFLPEYLEHRLAWLQDPETSIYSNGTFRVPSREYEEHVNGQFKDDKGVLFAIYELDTLTLIGETALFGINHADGTAMFGINIGLKAYWSKGFGTEATRLVLDYGFRFLNLYNIALITFSFNERAIHAYLKSGFKEMGRRRGSVLLNGRRYDNVYMDCLASEFASPRPGWFVL